MSLDIKWTLVVEVPQLDELITTINQAGSAIVASIDSIKAEIVRLNENQAAIAAQQASQAAALNEQVTKIANEVAQWNASGTPVTDVQMTNLEAALRSAADAAAQHATTAEQQAAAIRANTQAIGGIIPDAPVTP